MAQTRNTQTGDRRSRLFGDEPLRASSAGDRFLGPLICFMLGIALVLVGIRGAEGTGSPPQHGASGSFGPHLVTPVESDGSSSDDPPIVVKVEDEWVVRPDVSEGFFVYRLQAAPLEAPECEVPAAAPQEVPSHGLFFDGVSNDDATEDRPGPPCLPATPVDLLDRLAALLERLDLAGIEADLGTIAPRRITVESAVSPAPSAPQVGKTSG